MRLHVEAAIDFPEEDIDFLSDGALKKRIDLCAEAFDELLEKAGTGRLLRDGFQLVIVGKPNVGKSSLLNALARRERAIVTPHPGTTRDTVECTIDLQGYPLTLVDTAGIRPSSDPVEREGMERTREAIEAAPLVICMHHVSEDGRDIRLHDMADRDPDVHVIEVLNKSDLLNGNTRDPVPDGSIRISAIEGSGLDVLEKEILDLSLIHI